MSIMETDWRIKESTLFITSALLGSPGVLLGMYAFRHKTKHASFVYGVPAILFIQIFALYYFNIYFLLIYECMADTYLETIYYIGSK